MKIFYMITKKLLTILALIIVSFLSSCGGITEYVQLTKDLKWIYFNETNSSLLWKGDAIIGPGSITLKCNENYAIGIVHKNKESMFFIIDLKTGELIKNPKMRSVIYKYNIRIHLDEWYTQSEIFGRHKSAHAIKILKKDMEKANNSRY